MLVAGRKVLAIVSALAPFIVASCGSGGGDARSLHPPAASNLRLSSPVLVDGVTGTAEVFGQLDFSDAGGDLAFLSVSAPGFTRTFPITNAGGVTAGTGLATVVLALSAYGSMTFDVWLVDSTGASSNRLTGTVDFVPDDRGLGWTQVSTLPALAVATAPGSGHPRYVAVGSGGLIVTSEDGALWTRRVSPVTSTLRGVAWSGARFVAVGDGSTVVTSDDGLLWTARALPSPGPALRSVSWGGGAFVAVGGDDYYPPVAFRSSDGVTWSEATVHSTVPFASVPFLDVAWGAGRWVAVGEAPYFSDDGLTWTQAPGDSWEGRGFAVGWNGSRFLAVGSGASWLSVDGTSWTIGAHVNAGNNWGLAWSGHHWLEVGLIGPDVKISTDGVTWTTQGSAPSIGVARLVWDGDRFPARYLLAGSGIWTSP